MAKTSGEIEKEFIEELKSITGIDLASWLAEIERSGIEKRNDIIKWLKIEKKFGHMHASLLAGIYFNNGKPVYGNEEALLENQFLKCPEMRPLFSAISDFIIKAFPGTSVIPKKTYVSFTAKKEFAAINVKPGEIRLGLDLGNVPFTQILQKSKLSGPMPRISHMLVISHLNQLDETFKNGLSESYKRVN